MPFEDDAVDERFGQQGSMCSTSDAGRHDSRFDFGQRLLIFS